MAAQVTASIAAAVSNFKLSRQVAALSRANRGVSWAFLFITWRYLMLRRPSCCILHRFRSFHCCQYFLLIVLNTRSVEFFLPCDAMRCTVFAIVILSACLSDTLLDCVHMVRPTIMISSPCGSPIILVSADIKFVPKFEGYHPKRGR